MFFVSSGFLCGIFGRWWKRLVLLAHADDLFFPLFSFGVYTGIGRWCTFQARSQSFFHLSPNCIHSKSHSKFSNGFLEVV